jgi:3-methyladenine DNA glycosylase/8-oxoguanine DNA glycosylase
MPELDYGVRKGMQIAYRMRKLPTPKRMHAVTAAWAPHRSLGSWYMWRVLELPSSRAARTRKPAGKKTAKARPKPKTKARATSKRRAR